MKKEIYHFSIRAYFGSDPENNVTHHQEMPLKDIPKWIECYRFTHPNVTAITVKCWFDKREEK